MKGSMKKLILLTLLLAGAGIATSQAQLFSNRGYGNRSYAYGCDYAPASPSCGSPAYGYRDYDHARFHRQLRDAHRDLHADLRHEYAHGASRYDLRRAHRVAHQELRDEHR